MSSSTYMLFFHCFISTWISLSHSDMGQLPPNFRELNLLGLLVTIGMLVNNLKFQIWGCKELLVKSLTISMVFMLSFRLVALHVDLLFQNHIASLVKDLSYPIQDWFNLLLVEEAQGPRCCDKSVHFLMVEFKQIFIKILYFEVK